MRLSKKFLKSKKAELYEKNKMDLFSIDGKGEFLPLWVDLMKGIIHAVPIHRYLDRAVKSPMRGKRTRETKVSVYRCKNLYRYE